MAVVQISKIQVRRGQKNAGSGLPQLASGEIGWAIDTQQLYIGNGAVSEGAPAVGNTEILTQHSDIFSLIDTYTYGIDQAVVQTGDSPTNPVERTLQARLDDRVSVRAFGAYGDGTDQTDAIQRAVDQLFINDATKGSASSRVVLHFEPGNYLISDTIYVPPYANLIGAGKDKTIITCSADVPAFQTVNSTSTPGSPASDATSTTINQAKYINVSGMTIETTGINAKALNLESCTDSIFHDLKLTGDWASSDAIVVTNVGISMSALSTPVTCSRNRFSNIEVVGFSYGVESRYDVMNNNFDDCVFHELGRGIVWGRNTNGGITGQLTGPLNNTVTNSEFRDIDEYGFWVATGKYNLSESNHYYDVGNTGGTEAAALYPVIQIDDPTNKSIDDYTSRFPALSFDGTYLSDPFVPHFAGDGVSEQGFYNSNTIVQAGAGATAFKLPADSDKAYVVDYIYRSNQVDALRRGSLHLTVDYSTSNVEIAEDYEYNGNISYITNLSFSASLTDEDADTNIDTLVVTYENTTTSDSADFWFRVKTYTLS